MAKLCGIIMCLFMTIAVYNFSLAQDGEKEIKAIADKYLDNILAGINENNLDKYSQNFAPEDKKSLTKEYLASIRTNMEDNLGKYKSRQYLGFLLRKGDKTLILWKAVFDGTKNDVLIQLFIIKKDNKYVVFGVLFG
jgi:hypothetical protein